MAPTSIPLRNAIKLWFVCKHPSHLEMQLKNLVHKNLCTRNFIISSTVAALTAHCCDIKIAKQTMMKARKKELGDFAKTKVKTESQNVATTP